MADLAADMRRAYELRGDTYSSMEVFGMLSRGAAEIERLTAALRDTPCPRPDNAAPDDLTVGQCVDRLECGCNTGAALTATPGRQT